MKSAARLHIKSVYINKIDIFLSFEAKLPLEQKAHL